MSQVEARPKLECTARVRELLDELDEMFEGYHLAADECHSLDVPTRASAELRKHAIEREIFGVAWRINKASKGEE